MPNDGWDSALGQFWQVTLLIPVAVLLSRWLARGRSHLAYGVLVVVLLKCVTPPIWSSRTGVFSWTGLAASNPAGPDEVFWPSHQVSQAAPTPSSDQPPHPVATRTDEDGLDEVVAFTPPIQPGEAGEAVTEPAAVSMLASVDWKWLAGLALLLIWLLGMCIVAGRLLWEIWQLRQWCRTAAPADPSIEERAHVLARQMGLPSTPEVLVTDEAVMPAAMGVWREVVLLPQHLIDSISPEEFEFVLAHELNHFRRWDTVIGSLQAVAQVVWWFHPLVWWLNRELRRYREQCCDEEILARLECRPPQYARCLLNVLELNEKFSPALGLAGMSPFEVTSQRLRNIMRTRVGFTGSMPRWCWLVLVAAALVVLPGAGLAPDANALPHVQGVSPPRDQIASLNGASEAEDTAAAPVAPDRERLPDALQYRWQAGDHHAYQTRIEVDLGDEIETYSGVLTLSVRSFDDSSAELVLGGMGLTSHRRPKPGRIPTLGAFSFPDIPRPTFGLPPERSVRVDAFGRILTERGELEQLPGLLGTWPSYLLQPLPGQPSQSWQDSATATVSFDSDQFRERTMESRLGGPYRSRPATESLQAALNADYEVTPGEDGAHVVTRTYTLATVEQVNGKPRAEMSGVKSITWNVERGVPGLVSEDARLVVREGNVATTYPITVTCELLQPATETTAADDEVEADGPAPPISYDGPAPVPSSDLPATEDTPIEAGDVVQVEWSGRWYPADVLAVEDDGRLRIHFRGFSDQWDTTVHRARVQLPGPEYGRDLGIGDGE